jgi:ribonuclease HII
VAESGTSTDLTGGLDEVGYGSWAGPIISVVAVFDAEGLARLPSGVTDSKKTSDKLRSALYLPICNAAKDVGVGHAWPWEIDKYGATRALQLSYARALEDLKVKPGLLYVDGVNRVAAWPGTQIIEPKADLKYRQVSAASMVAKYLRDTMMEDYAKEFPGYSWERNKGYGSPAHEEGIKRLGLVVDENNTKRYLHRRLYCRKVLIRGS